MATDPGAETRYLLPEEQSEQIFRDRIAPRLLAGAGPQDQPTVTIVSGQAGAGKTTLAADLAGAFADRGGAVSVDVDLFRSFHPAYTRLTAEHGPAAGDLVHADARRWFERSLDHLAAQRVNVIAEHGLRNRDVTDGLLDRFNRAGYRIEAALLGTPAAQSKLGILERYQVGYEKTGVGRIVSEELHDARYEHLLQVADWLQDDPRVTAVGIYRYGVPDAVHRNARSPEGIWERPPTLRDALIAERERPWGTTHSRRFLLKHHSLAARMGPDWAARLTSALSDAAPLLHPDTPQGPTRDRAAVTYGRYQLVSIAHLDTIRTIAYDWPRVVIGVLDLQARPEPPAPVPDRLRDFYRTGEINMAPERNPMSVEERVDFWQAALDAAGLADRVSVEPIPPPELDPETFNQRFPATSYDVVFPAAGGAELPHHQRAEILGRSVHTVDPPLEYHTSDIRQSYREGSDNWRRALAAGTLTAFVAADGPDRLLSIEGKPDPVADNLRTAQENLRAAQARLWDRPDPPAQGSDHPRDPAPKPPGPDMAP